MPDRGQTFTLEAFVSAILLLATLGFALHIVSISSNSASVGDTELRNQHAGLASGVLDKGVANGSLRRTLLYWDEHGERFYDADNTDGFYISRGPPTTFGGSLQPIADDRQVRYNIRLFYQSESGERASRTLVESGTPSDDAVRVVETVTLYDDTRLVDENESYRTVTVTDIEANATADFYAPDARPNSSLYNVIRVEVVLWQT